MKTVFLSVKIFIFGCFCDVLRMLCRKTAENRLKRGKSLAKRPIIALSAFTERSLIKWQKCEKQLIFLLAQIS